ncbi:M50 family metallopeptidase [Halobacillus yeomjeoni]|uniref:M50 family metallopeptidase n=1 Tax=Halobacillus yeomjeoni TaxID=311194 RepID=UPI001CD53BB1|nr:M50 family metallopeptidase [Halobacillus yeomjeoni]MCA0984922.1 M50 family metallopeptidase [Halobacillus yeomjeoni]
MKTKIIVGILVALLLTQMPVIGKYFAILNTMIHETGHSFFALITGGEVQRISLFPDTSGTTLTGHSSWWSQFLTSIAGYVTSSYFAFLFLSLLLKEKYKWIIYILLVFLSINLFFWVRNLYGLFWIGSFAAGFIWLLKSGNKTFVQYVLVLIASLVFVEAITSAFEIMWVSFVTPLRAGDAANLAQLTTFIPSPIWGIVFFVQAVCFSWFALKKVLV